MPLETGSLWQALNRLWPLDADFINEGAGHIRLLKDTTLNQWPNVTDACNPSSAEVNALVGLLAELNALSGWVGDSDDLNQIAGLLVNAATLNLLVGLTANAAEINVLDGHSITTAELNRLENLTLQLSQLNGLTASGAELNRAVAQAAFTDTKAMPNANSTMAAGDIDKVLVWDDLTDNREFTLVQPAHDGAVVLARRASGSSTLKIEPGALSMNPPLGFTFGQRSNAVLHFVGAEVFAIGPAI